MAAERAAVRYAKALYSLAFDEKATQAVHNDMVLIASTIAENNELNQVLQNPIVHSKDKKAILSRVFPKVNTLTTNLINTLVQNKRIAILSAVASTYNQLYDAAKGTQDALVITAVPLNDTLKKKVLAKVKELTQKEANLINTIDASIVGGFILRIGDLQYDASVINQLNKIKRQFTLN